MSGKVGGEVAPEADLATWRHRRGSEPPSTAWWAVAWQATGLGVSQDTDAECPCVGVPWSVMPLGAAAVPFLPLARLAARRGRQRGARSGTAGLAPIRGWGGDRRPAAPTR